MHRIVVNPNFTGQKQFSNGKTSVRRIKNSFFEDRFSIRIIESLVAEEDLIHELHRHDFYFVH